MRGKEFVKKFPWCAPRITPAYAGKRAPTIRKIFSLQDHPRLCGEKPPVGVPDNKITGSPPPMRGKAKAGDRDRIEGRITPAYAGKSSKLLLFSLPDQDHPRLCGEKRFIRKTPFC